MKKPEGSSGSRGLCVVYLFGLNTLGAVWNGAMSNHVANLCKEYKLYSKVTSTDKYKTNS